MNTEDLGGRVYFGGDLPSLGTEGAREDIEAVIACLGDDAVQLRDSNPEDERADNMDAAGTLITALVSERDALAGRVAELEAERDAAAETACGAVRKAFSLGQTYWQQADSEYSSQHRKADDTFAKFRALVEETRAALSTTPESKP